MTTLTLYTNPMSRGRVARWMLEEVGQPYEVRVLEFGAAMRRPEYLALNPMGKVPTLTEGDLVITEVVAICTWLAERFPDCGLQAAPGTAARAAYLRWLFFIAGPLEMALTAKQCGWRIDADNRMSVGCGLPEEVLETIRQQLARGGWLCGEHFTVADLLLASYLGWCIQSNQLEAELLYADYVARAEARPAAQRAAALDDALAR